MRTPGLCLALIATAQLVVFSSPALAADPPAAAPAAPAPASADGTVLIHINSSLPVTLERRTGDTGAWQTVCTSPCDTRVPATDQYQISGDKLNPSKPFWIDGSRGDKVTLDVAPGEKRKASTGTAFLVTGAVLAVAGIVTMIVATAAKNAQVAGSDGSKSDNGYTDAWFVGGGLLFAGLGVGIYGLGTMVNNGTTAVGGDVRSNAAHASNDSIARTLQAAAQKPAFMLPVLSGKF